MRKRPTDNKFHVGNGADGKHYWLTPPALRYLVGDWSRAALAALATERGGG